MGYGGLILGAILILGGWQGPTPKQTTTNGIKKNATSDQNQTKHSVPIARRTATDHDTDHSGEKTEKNGEESVRIIAAPKIATQSQKDFWDKALVIATWVLVFVGAFQIIFLWRTVRATMDNAIAAKANAEAVGAQTETLRDTAQRQLRAYVLVESALLKFPNPTTPEAQVHLKNFGQTPAYDYSGWISMWIADYPLVGRLPSVPSNLLKGNEPLPPGRVSIHVASLNHPVEPLFVDLLGTPKATIYVFGEIAYRDTFGEERFTRYRLLHGGREAVQPMKNAQGTVTGYLLKADKEGNESG